MYRFVCVVLMAVAVSADHLKFKDCGHSEVQQIDVTGCSGDVCTLHKGEKIVFEVDLTPNQDSKTGKIDMIAKMGDIEVQVPGLDTDACHFTDCPFKKGEKKVILYKMQIPDAAPEVTADLTLKLTGDDGLMACIVVTGKIIA